MASRTQVLALLDAGHSFQTAAAELDISPGLALMIATGRPADVSDDLHPDELAGRPALPASTQSLVNPHQGRPVRNERVLRWVRERAARDLSAGS